MLIKPRRKLQYAHNNIFMAQQRFTGYTVRGTIGSHPASAWLLGMEVVEEEVEVVVVLEVGRGCWQLGDSVSSGQR